MKQIVQGDETVAKWVADRIPHLDEFEPPYTALAVVDDSRIVAGAIYNNYKPPDLHGSFACDGPGWASRDVIKTLLGFPFEGDCRRITAFVRKSDKRTRGFIERLGFKMEGVHPLAFPNGGTGLSYGLYDYVFKGKWYG